MSEIPIFRIVKRGGNKVNGRKFTPVDFAIWCDERIEELTNVGLFILGEILLLILRRFKTLYHSLPFRTSTLWVKVNCVRTQMRHNGNKRNIIFPTHNL